MAASSADLRKHPVNALRQLADARLGEALTVLQRAKSPAAEDAAVHTARKRLKEVRAVLRLLRPIIGNHAFRKANLELRDAARPMSTVRDAKALIAAAADLEKTHSRALRSNPFPALHDALAQRHRTLREALLATPDTLHICTAAIAAVRKHLAALDIDGGAASDVLLRGLKKAYRKARDAYGKIDGRASDETLHECRKRVKDLRYQCELLEPLWPQKLKPSAKSCKRLGDLLGDDHDLAVLSALLGADLRHDLTLAAVRALRPVLAARRSDLQRAARTLGQSAFAATPKEFIKPMTWSAKRKSS